MENTVTSGQQMPEHIQAKCAPKYLQNKYQHHQQTWNNFLKQHLDILYTECFLYHLPEGRVMEEALEHVD